MCVELTMENELRKGPLEVLIIYIYINMLE